MAIKVNKINLTVAPRGLEILVHPKKEVNKMLPEKKLIRKMLGIFWASDRVGFLEREFVLQTCSTPCP